MCVCVRAFVLRLTWLVFSEGAIWAFLLVCTLQPVPCAALQAGTTRRPSLRQMSWGCPASWAPWSWHQFGCPLFEPSPPLASGAPGLAQAVRRRCDPMPPCSCPRKPPLGRRAGAASAPLGTVATTTAIVATSPEPLKQSNGSGLSKAVGGGRCAPQLQQLVKKPVVATQLGVETATRQEGDCSVSLC